MHLSNFDCTSHSESSSVPTATRPNFYRQPAFDIQPHPTLTSRPTNHERTDGRPASAPMESLVTLFILSRVVPLSPGHSSLLNEISLAPTTVTFPLALLLNSRSTQSSSGGFCRSSRCDRVFRPSITMKMYSRYLIPIECRLRTYSFRATKNPMDELTASESEQLSQLDKRTLVMVVTGGSADPDRDYADVGHRLRIWMRDREKTRRTLVG